MENLTAKEKAFIEEVISFNQYEPRMLNDFYDYWTEPNKKGTMKWELEKTWDTKRRLKRWFDNNIKWSKNAINKNSAASDFLSGVKEDIAEFYTRGTKDFGSET